MLRRLRHFVFELGELGVVGAIHGVANDEVRLVGVGDAVQRRERVGDLLARVEVAARPYVDVALHREAHLVAGERGEASGGHLVARGRVGGAGGGLLAISGVRDARGVRREQGAAQSAHARGRGEREERAPADGEPPLVVRLAQRPRLLVNNVHVHASVPLSPIVSAIVSASGSVARGLGGAPSFRPGPLRATDDDARGRTSGIRK